MTAADQDYDEVMLGRLVPVVGGMVNGHFIDRVSNNIFQKHAKLNHPSMGLTDITGLSALIERIRAKGVFNPTQTFYHEDGEFYIVMPNGRSLHNNTPTATLTDIDGALDATSIAVE